MNTQFISTKKLAIVGCGRLGGLVAKCYADGLLPEYQLVGLYSRSLESAENLSKYLQQRGISCPACSSYEELYSLNPDIIAEAASPAAMKTFALEALGRGISIAVLSIGAFADDEFYEQTKKACIKGGSRVYLASGATGGFDVLRAAALMGGATAQFFNEKGPRGLVGTDVFEESLLHEQKEVFRGTAKEAIAKFPTRVNVTVAASRASVGPENMQVTMQCSPYFIGDTQKVEIRNPQVRAIVDVYSATPEIAGYSLVSTLQNIVSPIVF